MAKKSERTGGKKKKDPNAPKRPPSAYLIWAQEMRSEVVARMAKDPELCPAGEKPTPTAVMKQLGAEWGRVTAEQKKIYENRQDEVISGLLCFG